MKLTINYFENAIEETKNMEWSNKEKKEKVLKELNKNKSIIVKKLEEWKKGQEILSSEINNETSPQQFPTALMIGVIIVLIWLIFKR